MPGNGFAEIGLNTEMCMIKRVVDYIYRRGSIERLLSHVSTLIKYRWGLNKLGKRTFISPYAHFFNMRFISIGNNSTISRRSSLLAFTSYQATSHKPDLSIGDNVHIGQGCTLACCNKITIGDRTTIGDNVYIADNTHGFSEVENGIMEQALSVGSIRIGRNSWIGYGCFIASDVEIGNNSIIGANSVVKKTVPPFSVVAGSPARIIKKYDYGQKRWNRVVAE